LTRQIAAFLLHHRSISPWRRPVYGETFERQLPSRVVLQGSPAKGPHHSLIKLPAGFTAPLHHHTSDHYVAVVAGTIALTVDGKETKLPAGSFFSFTARSSM
jgi:quercetin dioxygenase-like cupin family protein